MRFLFQQLPTLRETAEMWPLEPSTAYFRWSKGLPTQYGDLVVATWDASVHGIALSIAIRPGRVYQLEGMRSDGVSTIVTFEDTPKAQVHREAAGAPVAMRLLRRLFDLRNRTVLLRNDCLPVIFAIQKGSPSQVLQRAAEDVCKEALEAGCRVLALHVPGVQLIDERIDGGSREAGPACTQRTRNEIRALLAV